MKNNILFLALWMATSMAASAQVPVSDASLPGRQTVGVAGVVGITGKGFGLHYEHRLNKTRTISGFLQTSCCWSHARQANLFYKGAYVQGHDRYPFMMSVQPGIRFYPKGDGNRVHYALDVSFLYTSRSMQWAHPPLFKKSAALHA